MLISGECQIVKMVQFQRELPDGRIEGKRRAIVIAEMQATPRGSVPALTRKGCMLLCCARPIHSALMQAGQFAGDTEVYYGVNSL
jgi:hypothetical protein